MKVTWKIIVATGMGLGSANATGTSPAPLPKNPNVVLIVCDDLNDYMTGIPGQTGHPQALTPHVNQLATSGVAFRHAYSNNPVCAPSRASFLTGIYPHTSGNLFWNKWFKNPVLKNSRTLMEHFRDNGYHVAGTGKLMHHLRREVWSEFAHKADYGPFVYDGEKRVAHPSVPEPFRSIGPVDGSFASLADVPFSEDDDPKSGWIYGTWGRVKPLHYTSEKTRDRTPDERNAKWAEHWLQQFIREGRREPFFLGVGFIRPHTPLHVPQKYFDRFPLRNIQLPTIKKNDADDCHYADVYNQDRKGLRYFRLLTESYPKMEAGIRSFTQAYLASVAAVDECIGQVVDAVDNSPLRDNTIIVLLSDHGWSMGQKDYLFKNSLWEESTRIPFIIRAPGIAQPGGVAEHPISLIDLYPTLVDLCGLNGDTVKNEKGAPLDGHSVRPFLEDPENGEWDGPDGALTMIYVGNDEPKESREDLTRQHWSFRTKRWRYILYNNGMEELYDHLNDPHEWTNIARNPEHTEIKKELKRKMLVLRKRSPEIESSDPRAISHLDSKGQEAYKPQERTGEHTLTL